MKKTFLFGSSLALLASMQVAQAHTTTYNITQTYKEPQTQPKDTIFIGSFDFDEHTMTVSNLVGKLSQSMTTYNPANDVDGNGDINGLGMVWKTLDHQLSAIYDSTLGGLLVTTFLNDNTNTFSTSSAHDGTDGWEPGSGLGWHYGLGLTPKGPNPGNAYARIFVNTTNPLAPLTTAQLDKIAYADCSPGGMMMQGRLCMTGTTVAGYGVIGSMDGYPISQVITAAVPEPESYAMMLAGLGLLGFVASRRKTN